MNNPILRYMLPDSVLDFVRDLISYRCNWENKSECTENYDYTILSQKLSDGLEKYETNVNGNKIIFSALPQGAKYIFNLEISYDDEPARIYEIPFLDDEDISTQLDALLKQIHEQDMLKYRKMNQKLFTCLRH